MKTGKKSIALVISILEKLNDPTYEPKSAYFEYKKEKEACLTDDRARQAWMKRIELVKKRLSNVKAS